MGAHGEPLRIAPSRHGGHWAVDDWKAINFDTEEGWQRAIDILEDRIRGRFLAPIEAIEDREFSGFAVMALDCLLIETLQQFIEGVGETPPGCSESYFRRFLTETSFGEHFDEAMAEQFYKQIRCGILHQAETKGTSKIWLRGDSIVQWDDEKEREGLLIHRQLFHKELRRVFDKYLADLRKSRPPNEVPRRRFKRKMDFICRAK